MIIAFWIFLVAAIACAVLAVLDKYVGGGTVGQYNAILVGVLGLVAAVAGLVFVVGTALHSLDIHVQVTRHATAEVLS